MENLEKPKDELPFMIKKVAKIIQAAENLAFDIEKLYRNKGWNYKSLNLEKCKYNCVITCKNVE